LRNDSPTPDQHRACGACGRTFLVQGRKAYCDDACRQRGFRRRQRLADEIQLGLATRLPKTAIVYQCPECDSRYLGQQRCDDCGVWCQRLGPGGPCPHCDDPVAIADLLAAIRSTSPATMHTTEVTPRQHRANNDTREHGAVPPRDVPHWSLCSETGGHFEQKQPGIFTRRSRSLPPKYTN